MAAAPPKRMLNRLQRLQVIFFVFAVSQLAGIVRAQNRTTTDPSEARAVNAIFNRWGISETNQWNISGELRSGVATDDASQIQNLNPAIKCDCTAANNRSTCHISALRVYALDVSGPLPDELWNLTFLTSLDLRQNYLTGPIPATIGNLLRMQYLSLGINALSGEVPRELGLLTNLISLAFGTNSFTGPLPSELGNLSRLTQIYFDSSGVSGPIPETFVNLRSLEIVWASDNALTGRIPNFIGTWFSLIAFFAINSGGRPILSSEITPTIYESENETLGPATYYVTSSGRWGISNVGLPASSNNRDQYQTSSESQFTNTLDARLSAGSLRYYGLGLENGNYTVRLQFAETQIILGTNSWRSLGRRVFDIYVQGNLERRDFDIVRQAGGVPLRVVVEEFSVLVTENYMEVHLFWAGKGTCCVPNPGVYGPLISAINAIPNFVPTVANRPPDFVPTVANRPPGGDTDRTGIIVGIVVGVVAVSFLALGAVFYVYRKRKMQRDFEDEELLGMDTRPYTFSYGELRSATEDFNLANKLGEGGFGPVYKGTLVDGSVVAVKQLSVTSHQGKSQFLAEIATISAVQHRNLVKLHGCCLEGDKRLLVYEFLVNKSLDQLLFGTGSKSLFLDWSTRYNICLGVASGLAYLHEESRLRIVHRDVKASNILLDSDLVPKISDFGLAKLYDDKKTHMSTRVAGTIGYLAPEYAMRGHLTEKADIFSFGVVALEMVSGRPNSDASLEGDKIYLLEWAWNLHESEREIDLVDLNLQTYDANEVTRIIWIALVCTQLSPSLRPKMSRVVGMLSGDIEVPSVTTRPAYLTDWNFNDTTSFASEIDCSMSNSDVYTGTNPTTTAGYSPANPAKPILDNMIGEGS